MDLKTVLAKHNLLINKWSKEINTLSIQKQDKDALYDIAKYYPELNTKLKADSGCSSCLKNCMKMVITKHKGDNYDVSIKTTSDLDKPNIHFHINPAYKLNTVNIKHNNKLISIVDIDSFVGDNINTFNIHEATEIIKDYLKSNTNMLKYFEIEEECDGKALVFDEEVINIEPEVVVTTKKLKLKK